MIKLNLILLGVIFLEPKTVWPERERVREEEMSCMTPPFSWASSQSLTSSMQGRFYDGKMGTITPIDFKTGPIAPIDFHWKQGLKGNLHSSIEIPNGWSGVSHPLIWIPNNVPAMGRLALLMSEMIRQSR